MAVEVTVGVLLWQMSDTCHAVSAVSGTPAAASKPRLAGMSATSASGMAIYSAYVPVCQAKMK